MAKQTIPVQSGYAKQQPKIECRACVRFPIYRAMMASTTDIAVSGWLGAVHDISCRGVAIVLRRGFTQGTNLIVDLATNSGELRSLPAQVIHARWERRGRWILGCEFASPLSEQELNDLIGRS